VEAEQITQQLQALLQAGLFMDPLLMNTYFEGRSLPTWDRAQADTDRLYRKYAHVHYFLAELGDIPFSPRLARRCLMETLMSTAVYIANESSGSVIPTDDHLVTAESRVEDWIDKRGIETLYKLYFVIVAYDFLQPMFFHRHVYEADFLNGARHYPYTPDSLDTYLLAALARGSVRIKNHRCGRVIQPTKVGVNRFHWIRQSLEDSGYLAKRVAMSYVYQFDTIEDWDALCNIVWPDAINLRRSFLDWVGVEENENVLEVGCGTGALTFDCGLAERVLPGGHLTAIDVSSGMLDQARRKYMSLGSPQHVELTQASVEHLPYADETFDVCLASAVLHFTDGARSVREMTRVVRQHGVVSALQALAIETWKPFFADWFQPVLELARKNRRSGAGDYLPTEDDLRSWFTAAGLTDIDIHLINASWVFDSPEVVVQHIVRGVSFFQSEMVYLPWDDQRTLISELIDRGRDVCRNYPLSERIIELPSVFIRGRKP
jgi:ubiquinone/menaquinone biosynthesis C-methylase UbiE